MALSLLIRSQNSNYGGRNESELEQLCGNLLQEKKKVSQMSMTKVMRNCVKKQK